MSANLRQWFTLSELADARLRGMPSTRQGWCKLADRGQWNLSRDDHGKPLSRARAAKGGGIEYHWSILDSSARNELVRRGIVVQHQTAPLPFGIEEEKCWSTASDAARERALARLAIVKEINALVSAGSNRDHSVAMVSLREKLSRSAIYGWISKVAGEPSDSWPEMLLDEMKGGRRKVEIPAALWSFYESWWLRQSKPTHADAYRRTVAEAKRLGITALPSAKTFQRRAEQIPPEVVALKRGGEKTAAKLAPYQARSVQGLHALEAVNADGHKWDFRVRFPDGTEGRPMTLAIQDIYSRKFLSWRHGKSESTTLVRLAFVDLFRNWGFPAKATIDNGRAFASKDVTGGTRNRYRYKVNEDDPDGLLTRFGIEVHWAMPERGSSKPIERGFRDFAQTISRHAAFDGAWVGNSVANKPENHGRRVVEWEDFVRIVDAEIRLHNSRTGRQTEMARGRSFDEVFAESYAQMPVRKATEAQLRDCLLSAEKVRADRDSGAVRFMGNVYWQEGMAHLAGEKLQIYYDPDDLHTAVHVHDASGRFLLTAPIWQKTGFYTEDHGKARMKVERDLLRNARREAELRGLLSAQELAHRAMLAAGEEDTPAPEPKVIRPVRTARLRGSAAIAVEPVHQPSAEVLDRMKVAFERLRLVEDDE